jgi:replicative DNA helicase
MSRDVEQLRAPPQSIEAEQAVLGALMIDPRAFAKVAKILTEEHFYRRDHQLIFRAIQWLESKGRPFDAVTLGEWMEARGRSDLVPPAYLIDLHTNTPSSANVKGYAEIVRDKAILRQLIDLGTEIVNDGFVPDGRDTHELIAAAEQRVLTIGRVAQANLGDAENGRRVLARTVSELERRLKAGHGLLGCETSIDALDRMILGFQPTDLIVLAARPSMGKTALMGRMRRHAARAGLIPFTLSMEMSTEQLTMRDLAAVARVNLRHVQLPVLASEEEMARIHQAMLEMQQWDHWTDDQSSLTVEQVCSRIRRAKAQYNIGIAFIDYLQFIDLNASRHPGQSTAVMIQHITRMLKGLAKELKIPIVLLSQLNRGLESRGDKRPVMSDLRESGAIEQDADVILFLHRPAYYERDLAKDDPKQRIAEIIVAKCRNGETGIVTARAALEFQDFDNMAADEIDDYFAQERNNEQTAPRDRSGVGFQGGNSGRTGSKGADRRANA